MKQKKKNNFKAFLPIIIVCIVLIAAIGLILALNGNNDEPKDSPQSTIQSSNASVESTASEDPYGDSIIDLGTGKVTFIFNVVDREGYSQLFRIHTDKKTVGDALLEQRLIEGVDGDPGFYVKSVLGTYSAVIRVVCLISDIVTSCINSTILLCN